MATIITINELIQMFDNFTSNHKQLDDFGYGPTSDIGTSRQMTFPYLWITHRVPSTFSVENKTLIPTLNLTFIIVDQINNQVNINTENGLNSDNQQEIISDTFQIAQDLVSYISASMGKYGVKLTDDDVDLEAMFDETDDKVSGWVLDISLQLTHHNCVLPIS